MRGYRGGNVAGLTLRPFLRSVPKAPAVGLFCGCDVGYVAFGGLPRPTAEKCHDEKTTLHCPLNRKELRGTLRGMIGQKRKNPK